MGEWQGRVAFISGGVSGLGLGLAKAFSDAGMRLALSYRNEAYREAAAEWFESNGRETPLWVRLDVLDRAGIAYKLFDPTKYNIPGSFGNICTNAKFHS